MSTASRPRAATRHRSRASSACSTRADSLARRAPTCWLTPSSPPASATRACTSASPAGARRRTRCASASASTRASSGWLEGGALADAYASADLFLFASRTDTFGQVLLEAQASGLPVVAVAEGGPCSIVEDGVTGRLCPPDAQALAGAVVDLAAAPLQRERLAQQALETVRERTWERALGRLAEGYRRALGERQAAGTRRAA